MLSEHIVWVSELIDCPTKILLGLHLEYTSPSESQTFQKAAPVFSATKAQI